MESQYNSKLIAKNTIVLYVRMIVVTLVSFFTVRMTLKVLGVEDFGIYNVVGGVVSFLGIINTTMSSATQRYLAYNLGRGDMTSYQNTFSLLIIVYVVLCITVLVFGELFGPWLIKNYLTIPEQRITAAYWVYQFSLISFCLSLLGTPYMASIIAFERMGMFAALGLFDAFGKLLIVYLLLLCSSDKLIIYALLLLLISMISFLIQFIYCRKKLDGCTYHFYWDGPYLKEIVSYTGWNLFGATSGTLNTAGLSIILNIFYGPLVNAAKGIADKINSAAVSFSINFYQAISPQIIKTYASGEKQHSLSLVYRSSKLSYYLMFVISLPIICGMPFLLRIWLGPEQVTVDMIVFSRLMLIYSLVNVFEQPLTMLIRATGEIKRYQVFVGIITLCTIPLSIVFFLTGFPAYWSIVALTIVYFVALIVRLLIARNQVDLSLSIYLREVFLPAFSVTAMTILIVIFFNAFLKLSSVVLIMVSFFVAGIVIWVIGLKKEEKAFIIKRIPFNISIKS